MSFCVMTDLVFLGPSDRDHPGREEALVSPPEEVNDGESSRPRSKQCQVQNIKL